MYVFTAAQEDGESHDTVHREWPGSHLALMEKAYAALKASIKSDKKETEVLARKLWISEQENAVLRENHIRDVRHVSDRNVALEKKVQSLGAEVRRLDAENRRLKKKLNDYYRYDSDSTYPRDESDYGASYNPVKPKPKNTDDDVTGWGAAALGALGLGVAGAVGAALVSKSFSSDDKKKSKKDSSWF